ncbi:hypothetical protein [Rhizobium sp. BK376]|uniref:hypothetical protein n=1 Tax=Rhizobium sp. BK376 TaxID=2512149 RepID=UPI0010EF8F52|nr:hypothetical protein [Rhizobium sp. BK376]TCR76671.1 hypothetical protein EV561_12029 [Rhizobium sp. BK376]
MDDQEHDRKGEKPDTSEERLQIDQPIQESSAQEATRPSVSDKEPVTPIDGGRQGSTK